MCVCVHVHVQVQYVYTLFSRRAESSSIASTIVLSSIDECVFCDRRSGSRRCAWPPPSSTPSRRPSPPLAPTPATAATSRFTAPPPQSASAWRASTSSPSRCVHIHFRACVCHLYFCTCRWDTSMRGSRELRNACINRLVMLQFNCVCSSRSLSLGRSSPGSLSSSRGLSSSSKLLLDLSRETDWQLTQ